MGYMHQIVFREDLAPRIHLFRVHAPFVARKALAAGASIVNDISGLRFSPDMAPTIADYGAAVVLMHIKGTPRDMQVDPHYDDVVGEIMDYLDESAAIALKAGIGRDRIMIDPGIGFGKTLQHNLEIIGRLKDEGIATVIISHNLQHVFSVVDRIVVIRRGVMRGERLIGEAVGDEIVSMITGSAELRKLEFGLDTPSA